MEKYEFFFRHYDLIVITSHIAIMAGLIFMMGLSTPVQIGFLIASALILSGMLYSRGSGYLSDPPIIGVARPRT